MSGPIFNHWKIDRTTGLAWQSPQAERIAFLLAEAAVKRQALLADTKPEATASVQKIHLKPVHATANKQNVAYMQQRIAKCLDYVTQRLTIPGIQKLCVRALLGNYGVRENEVREHIIMNKMTKKKTKSVAVQTSPMDVALTTRPINLRKQMTHTDLTCIELD